MPQYRSGAFEGPELFHRGLGCRYADGLNMVWGLWLSYVFGLLVLTWFHVAVSIKSVFRRANSTAQITPESLGWDTGTL